METCADCGFDNRAVSRYCAGCGLALAPSCARCGAVPPTGARFCPECGVQLVQGGGVAGLAARGADATALGEDGSRATIAPALRGQTHPTERRQVTILYADIVGSTRLAEMMDPEDLSRVIDGALQRMAAAVIDSGGTVGRMMGDGVLALFGAPKSFEDDALRAVRTGLAIRVGIRDYSARLKASGDPPIEVRVGIDTGLVVVGHFGGAEHGEYTPLGDAANTAARLQSEAPPGAVYVSEETARLVRGLVSLEGVGELTMKGKATPVRAFRVVGEVSRSGTDAAGGRSNRALDGTGAGDPHGERANTFGRMIGRDAELSRLVSLYDEALVGRRVAWASVVGEAGVGKSRLCRACLEALDEHAIAPVVWSARAMVRMSDAYSVVRELLVARYPAAAMADEEGLEAAIASDLRAAFAGDGARAAAALMAVAFGVSDDRADPRGLAERALAALGALARAQAAAAPLVILLEDLQWADDASLDAIVRMVEALEDQRAFVLCSARSSLYELRPEWGVTSGEHARIDLPRLPRAAVHRMVEALIDGPPPDALLAFVETRSEGNPLYVEELVRMTLERGLLSRADGEWMADASALAATDVPTTLVGLLQARLDSLAPDARLAVQHASVIGRTFWGGAVAAIGGRVERAVEADIESARAGGLVAARTRSSLSGMREYVFGHTLHNLGEIAIRKADDGEALRRFESAARLWRQLGHGDDLADALSSIRSLERSGPGAAGTPGEAETPLDAVADRNAGRRAPSG